MGRGRFGTPQRLGLFTQVGEGCGTLDPDLLTRSSIHAGLLTDMKVDVDMLNPVITTIKTQWAQLPEPVRQVAPFAGVGPDWYRGCTHMRFALHCVHLLCVAV